MSHQSSWAALFAGIAIVCCWTIRLTGQEADLLHKFQKQNQSAADRLKAEAARLLRQPTGTFADADAERLRKVLGQLQGDRLLPKSERLVLVRQLQERLRLYKELAQNAAPPPVTPTPAGAPVGDPKARVSPASLVIGGATVNVPDGGVRVIGGAGFMSQGRNEGGVPVLGKVPDLGRGFRNVGYGSSVGTIQSSVSVRIIILEEEAAKLMRQK
jgi:hypothetical protein